MVLAGPLATPYAKTFAVMLRGASKRPAAGGSPGQTGQPPLAGGARDPALEPFRKAFQAALRQVSRPARAILFVSGTPSPAEAVAEAVAELARSIDALVVPAAGVLTEAGEAEGLPAVAGVVLGGRSGSVALGASAESVAAELEGAKNLVLFHASEGFDSRELEVLSRGRASVFGAGAPGGAVLAVRAGAISTGRIAAMRLDGSAPIIEASAACKLVSDPLLVTEMDRSFILRLADEPALDALSSRTGGGRFGGLILIAVHDKTDPSRFLVRSLRGIDPGRKAISVAGTIEVGDTISFAVRDQAAAREGLASAARRAERQAIGSTPTFALFLTCAGRGRALYGEADGDVRVLRRSLPKIPICGMHGAFEIVPDRDGARMQLMSGIIALFRAAS